MKLVRQESNRRDLLDHPFLFNFQEAINTLNIPQDFE
jgi:hypothetical protein